MNEIIRYARRLQTVAAFLHTHKILLHEMSYTTATDKNPGTGHDQLSYVGFYTTSYEVTLTCHGPLARELMRMLRRGIGGQWEKSTRDSEWSPAFLLASRIPIIGSDTETIRIVIEAPRESVCTPRVVSTKTVTIPAVEAKPEQTKEVEVIEWDCGNLLDDEAPEAPQEALGA